MSVGTCEKIVKKKSFKINIFRGIDGTKICSRGCPMNYNSILRQVL